MTVHSASVASEETVDIFDVHTVGDFDHKLMAATIQRASCCTSGDRRTPLLTRIACRELHDDGPREFVNIKTVLIGAAR